MIKDLSWYIATLLVVLTLLFQFVLKLPKNFLVVNAFIAFGVALFIVVKATNYLVDSVDEHAKKFRLPGFLVGFVIISAVTSIPDLSAGLFAAQQGHGDLILGDVVTSVMVGMALLTAIGAILLKKMPTGKAELSNKMLALIVGLAIIPFIFGLDGTFERWEGVVLLLIFFSYLSYMVVTQLRVAHLVKQVPFKDVWQNIIVFNLAFVAILLASGYVVQSAVVIAKQFHIPTFLVGLFLVALGNSAPEIAFQIKTARSGVMDIGFGNAMGSLLVNTLLVTGSAAAVKSFTFPYGSFLFSYIYAIGTVIVAIFLYKQKYISWKQGIAMLGLFVVFLGVNVVFGTG